MISAIIMMYTHVEVSLTFRYLWGKYIVKNQSAKNELREEYRFLYLAGDINKKLFYNL